MEPFGQDAETRRVGLFGGTFDPPHNGHLVAAVWARAALELDEVRLVVAHRPWQKAGLRPIAEPQDRLALVRAAIAGVDGLVASDAEIARGGDSYLVDTLLDIRRHEPEVELYVVLGVDAAAGLESWHRWQELSALARFAIVDRPGSRTADLPSSFEFERVEIPQLAIASTDLRERAAAALPITGLVPIAVSSMIAERGLYRTDAHERSPAP